MTTLPPDVEARRTVENEALRLGDERARLLGEVGANLDAMLDGFDRAKEVGISIEQYASHLKVRRQDLYRWRNARAYLRDEPPNFGR
jgi:hypothetical protein